MDDEDINPVFPELEGAWVRKEECDAIRKELYETKDTLRISRNIAKVMGDERDAFEEQNRILIDRLSRMDSDFSIAQQALKRYAEMEKYTYYTIAREALKRLEEK